MEISGVGRTDVGVHARDYLNGYLPEDICVTEMR